MDKGYIIWRKAYLRYRIHVRNAEGLEDKYVREMEVIEVEGPAKVEGQVSTQLAALDDKLEALHKQITGLEGSLAPVVRAEPNVKGAEEPQQDLVPLAEQIRHYALRAERAATRLQDIMARLEL